MEELHHLQTVNCQKCLVTNSGCQLCVDHYRSANFLRPSVKEQRLLVKLCKELHGIRMTGLKKQMCVLWSDKDKFTPLHLALRHFLDCVYSLHMVFRGCFSGF